MKVSEEYLKGAIEDSINDNTRIMEWLKKEDFRESFKNDMISYYQGKLDAFGVVLRML